MQSSDLFTEREAAVYLGVTTRWMRRSRERRKIPFCKFGSLVRYRRKDLDTFVESRLVSADGGLDAKERQALAPEDKPPRRHSEATKAKIAASQRTAWERRRRAGRS